MTDHVRKIVVALGGNAISLPNEEGNMAQQFAHARQTASVLAAAIERGFQLIITHGNGPQVGNILRRVEIASGELYPIPLEVCVADTQAGMGYMIGQCLMNELACRGQPRLVTTIVTTVLVDADDPAFHHPCKPIGPRMQHKDAEVHAQNDGWTIAKTDGDFYRRLVPSPLPMEILELGTIKKLIDEGELIICCGGGGIPVFHDQHGEFAGAAAVIDKDRSSALLAHQLDCDALVMLTTVENACLDFGTNRSQPLGEITSDDAQRYLDEGHFAAGSMQPKMEAAIEFVRKSPRHGSVAIIAHLEQFVAALDGHSGTRVSRGSASCHL